MRTRPVLVLAAAAAIALVPSAALAHHPEVTGDQTCDGSVSFTAVAWNDEGATPEKRTNNDVRVKLMEAEGGATIAEFDDHFGPDNGFTFSGQHQLDQPREVVIKVTAKPRWGPKEDLAEPNTSRRTKVAAPTGCESTETTEAPPTTTPPTSTVAAVVVTAGPGTGGGEVTPRGRSSNTTAEGTLPFTGTSSTLPLLAGGLVLIATGLAAMCLGRSRPGRSGSRN
jgi:hypothetical protein